jgi:Acetyltransferase (GNAT) family
MEIIMDTLIAPLEPSSETPPEPEGLTMTTGRSEIRVKGKPVTVPSVQVDGRTVIMSGKWLKKASVHDEDLLEGETITDPASFVQRLKQTAPTADIFTFFQRLPDTTPKYTYHVEWDNIAVIPITTFSDWWEKRVDPGVRRAVRKAAKAGVIVKSVEFDDTFVNGIASINNETPIRQGKPFWHFQKSFDAVKRENSTYAERNAFLGAYWQNELIGYIRITFVDRCAHILQLLTMTKHFDKKPANALVAKAVEIGVEKGMSHLVYCNYVYNDPKSSLTEFKRRNGFEKVLLPRYYVAQTFKGKVALSLGLHRGLAQSIPKPVLIQLLKMRSLWHARRLKGAEGTL